MTRVFLIGGNGYLGSHLAPALSAAGYDPVVIGREDDPEGPGPVVYLAGGGGPVAAEGDPLGAVRGVEHACRYARNPRRPLIFASSIYVYPPGASDCHEGGPLGPETLYGACKAAVEAGIEPAVVLRFGAIYGGRIDSGRPPEVLTRFALRAVVGQPLEATDPDRILDLIHVEDAVSAILAVLVDLDTTAPVYNEVYNVGGNAPVTVADLAERVVEAAVHRGCHRSEIRRGDVRSGVLRTLNLREAESSLGWTPAWTLSAGIEAVVAEALSAADRRTP